MGVGCRLRDAIQGAEKLENDRDIRGEERDQQAEVGKQQGDASVAEDVFLGFGKHTRTAALSVRRRPALERGSI